MTNIALVGTGGMGNVHYANWKRIEGAKIVAIVGKGEGDRNKAMGWDIPYFERLSDANAWTDFTVVDVCTPTFLHTQTVLEALKLGKHVICEKPLALSSSDAAMLFSKAEAMGKQLYVAQVVQFTKAVSALRSMVRKQEYGNVRSAHFVRLSASPAWSKDGWLFDKAKSGLIPFDLHIHDLDVIVSLFGKPLEAAMYPTGEPESHIDFLYRYPEATFTAEAAWYHASLPFTATWRVEFDHAVALNTGEEVIVYPEGKEAVRIDTSDPITVSTGINVPPTGWYYNELSHFLSCIEEGVSSPFVTKEQVLAVLETIEHMERA
ncbi:MAG: Gfo/Idh/MocA family oxidoreductase [Sphaerochaetaceae bacterium]|jgi:predicted dehydrogenase